MSTHLIPPHCVKSPRGWLMRRHRGSRMAAALSLPYTWCIISRDSHGVLVLRHIKQDLTWVCSEVVPLVRFTWMSLPYKVLPLFHFISWHQFRAAPCQAFPASGYGSESKGERSAWKRRAPASFKASKEVAQSPDSQVYKIRKKIKKLYQRLLKVIWLIWVIHHQLKTLVSEKNL